MSRLAQYFTGVVVKRLSEVEVNGVKSNQHEFNGIKPMIAMFGDAPGKTRMDARFIYMTDEEEDMLAADGFLTWYDARERHPVRTEFRMYFPSNEVMEQASASDLMIIARKQNGAILLIVVRSGSTIERQLLWLFAVTGENGSFTVQTIEGEADREIGYAERTVLETLGIEPEPEPAAPAWLTRILEKFGGAFPTTKLFSAFARETADAPSPLDDPDGTIMAWLSHEEMLFRTLERHIVDQRLNVVPPFTDVDDFIKYSLSVQNRRKSRAGASLEHHLREIFKAQGLLFVEQKITEQNSKPDFLFPGIDNYHDDEFNAGLLTMLGAKSSCKERWNQVLAEAERIPHKHLFTLEASISPKQTDKMQEKNLQLVLPETIHQTFLPEQQGWLLNLDNFVDLVKDRQAQAGL